MGIRIRSIAGAFALLSFSTVSGTRADPPHYVLTPLPWIGQIPGGLPGSAAGAINNLGQVVGSTTTPTGSHAFLYSNGSMQDLGALDGPDGAWASGINDAGQIVGVASTLTPTDYHAVTISPGGGMHDLGLAFTTDGQFAAYSINSAGVIVGTNGASAVIDNGGAIQTIPTPGKYAYAAATGINNSNQVIGYLSNGEPQQPFTYDVTSGTLQVLTHTGNSAGATGINNTGDIVGWWEEKGTGFHGMLYESNTWSDLVPRVAGGQSRANAINDLDEIVGWAQDPGETDGGYGFVYFNGTMYNLNDLVVNPLVNWRVFEPTAINDSGQIVGNLEYGGEYEAFLLTPTTTPEPASAVALFVASTGVLLRRIRVRS